MRTKKRHTNAAIKAVELVPSVWVVEVAAVVEGLSDGVESVVDCLVDWVVINVVVLSLAVDSLVEMVGVVSSGVVVTSAQVAMTAINFKISTMQDSTSLLHAT